MAFPHAFETFSSDQGLTLLSAQRGKDYSSRIPDERLLVNKLYTFQCCTCFNYSEHMFRAIFSFTPFNRFIFLSFASQREVSCCQQGNLVHLLYRKYFQLGVQRKAKTISQKISSPTF